MKRKKTRAQTLDEITDFIRRNNGPDLEGRAHSKIKRINYDDLRDALQELHARGEVPEIRAYHFLTVNTMWKGEDGEELARAAFGEFVAYHQRKGLTIDELIEKGDKYLLEERIPIPGCDYAFSIKNAIAQKHRSSFVLAMLDWLQNNPDEEIRVRYQHVRPWHFGVAPAGTWKGEQGITNAREAFGEFIVYQQSKGWSLADLIEKGDGSLFEQVPVQGCDVTFSIKNIVDQVYHSSFIAAMLDWLQNNPHEEIKRKYAVVKPWHFQRAKQGCWQGEQGKTNARAFVGELIRTLQERYHWNLSECLQRVSDEHFEKEPLPLHLPEKTIYYTASTLLNSIRGSFKDLILDWIKHNPDDNIRKEYAFWKPWYFSKAQKESWQGEQGKQNAREVIGKVVEHLREKGWSLIDLIQGISKDHFEEPLIQETPDGPLFYTASVALQTVYKKSPPRAVMDWIAHHPDKRIRNGYRRVRPWHFQKANQGYWQGEQGKTNARSLTTDLVQQLRKKYEWTLKDLIENMGQDHVRENLYLKTPDGVIPYHAKAMIDIVYGASPAKMILDWLAHHKDEKIRTGYTEVRSWHFKRAPSGTWTSEKNPKEAKRNGIEITDQLIRHMMRKKCLTEEEVVEGLHESDFIDEEMEITTFDGPIKYTAVGALQAFGSIGPAITAWKEYKKAG
ncbi:hypothetical protein J4410_04830 [Candidatus Woesearchaeota archaeon]|nr:hypothetical protein [Candidatus Woesearchaeota archaeon]